MGWRAVGSSRLSEPQNLLSKAWVSPSFSLSMPAEGQFSFEKVTKIAKHSGCGISEPDLAFLAPKIMKPLICSPQSSNFSQGYVFFLTLFKVKYSLVTTEYRKYRRSAWSLFKTQNQRQKKNKKIKRACRIMSVRTHKTTGFLHSDATHRSGFSFPRDFDYLFEVSTKLSSTTANARLLAFSVKTGRSR